MPEAMWKTGFVCTVCGREATVSTKGPAGGITTALVADAALRRLDREGGELTSAACGHAFRVVPGSRRPAVAQPDAARSMAKAAVDAVEAVADRRTRAERPVWYVLDGKTPRPATMEEGAAFFRSERRRVARDRVGSGEDAAEVSTVFLCLDHGFGDGPPVLFGSLVFGGPLDGEGGRYSTWEAAEAGHAALLARVRAGAPDA